MSFMMKTENGYIPISGNNGGSASEISYDNTDSSLEAENVQEAIDEIVETKADKTEISLLETELTKKADKSYTDAELEKKADKNEIYTKSQTDTAITNKVAEIVAGAPEDFDTLKEMSDWISTHEESAAAMNTAIQSKVETPQTAEVGQILTVKTVDTNSKPTEWKAITSVPIANGGTGATSASNARTNLGLGTAATKNITSSITGSIYLPTDTAVKTYVDGMVGNIETLLEAML